jgi:hypothetical protein
MLSKVSHALQVPQFKGHQNTFVVCNSVVVAIIDYCVGYVYVLSKDLVKMVAIFMSDGLLTQGTLKVKLAQVIVYVV